MLLISIIYKNIVPIYMFLLHFSIVTDYIFIYCVSSNLFIITVICNILLNQIENNYKKNIYAVFYFYLYSYLHQKRMCYFLVCTGVSSHFSLLYSPQYLFWEGPWEKILVCCFLSQNDSIFIWRKLLLDIEFFLDSFFFLSALWIYHSTSFWPLLF